MKNNKGIKQANNFLVFLFRFFGIKTLSVYQLILSLLIFTTVISVGLVFTTWTYSEILRVNTQKEELKKNVFFKQKEKLKTEVSRLISYLEYRDKDTKHHTLEQIKEEALLYFEDMRFGNDGYVFVNTYDGIALLFDGQKLEEKKDISKLTDSNGFKIFEKELELAKRPDGGHFQYLFKKIYSSKPQLKLSYVMGFDEWNWIVGTGDYLDNIEDEISLLEEGLKKSMYHNILVAFSVFIFILLLLILVSFWAAHGMQNQFNKFLLLKELPPDKKNEALLNSIFISELKTIGLEIHHAEELAKQFGDIIDQSVNEIFIFDQNSLKFVHANRGAIQNCGYSLSELQLMTPLDIQPELNLQQFQDLIMPLIQKNTDRVHFETIHQRKDKSYYPVDVNLTASLFKEKPVFVAFIYDITERKETENQLEISQQRYSDLFENAPVSLWEEDFTELMLYLDEQLKKYNLPIETLFEKYPEVLIQCATLVKVENVNKQTLNLFEAQNKEELYGNLNTIFTHDSINTFKNGLLALYRGEKYFSSEAENLNLKGKKLDVLLRWSFLSKDESLARKIIVSIVDLTDLRRKESELRESEFRFRSIFENNHTVMFLIDPKNGQIIDTNPAAVDFYGYSYDEFIRTISLYDLNTLSKKEVLQLIQKIKQQKKAYFNFKHRLANGEIRNVEVYSGLIQFENKPVLFSIVHDITERYKIKQDLEESKNKLESIFRAAPTGIGVVSNRVFTEVNERFCEMTGFLAKELINKESRFVYTSLEEFERVGKEKYEQIALAGTGTIETQFKRKDGKIIDVLMSSTPIDLNDLSKGVTFTALDITARNKITQELEKHRNNLRDIVNEKTSDLKESQVALLNLVDDLNKQSEELEKTNARLVEINEELETFTYSVSHDLKAPLRGIDGYSQLLLDSYEKDMDKEAREFLGNIRKSTQQMSLLIEDLLAYSRMERKDFLSVSINFKSIVDNLLLSFSKTITENHIQIKQQFPKNFELKADRDGLSLVLRNLLDNALKFSTKNKRCQIEIGASESDTHWHIFVKDNGIGFDMKYHDRIFKIFQRLHLPEEYEGTGIGLAMVAKAIHRMRGKIWAESELGKGTCFYFEIGKKETAMNAKDTQ